MLKSHTIGPKLKNSRVLRHLAKETVSASKGKSAVIILSIALCTFMFTALFTIFGSVVIKLQETTQRQSGGTADASLKYLNEAEYGRLEGDDKLKEVSERIYVGEVVNRELLKLRTEVHWADEVSAAKMFCAPEVGRLPSDGEENEIAVSSLVLKAFGYPAETATDYEALLGKTIPLKLECKNGTVEKEFLISGIYTGDRVSMSQIVLVSNAFQEKYAKTPKSSFYESGNEDTIADMYGRIDADIDFYLPLGVDGQLYRTILRDGLPENVETGVNWASLGSADLPTIILVLALLITIFLSGYLIISNVYRMNVYADIRSYGLLKTVGTSGRQLKKLVSWMATYHAIPGIVLGLFFGVIIGGMMLPRVMSTATFSDTTSTNIEINGWILLVSALFSYLTVRISIRRSMTMASRVSPMEALRFTKVVNERERGQRKKNRSFSTFGFAKRNVLRDRKKVFFVVLSLALSLVVLNSVYTLVDGFDEDKYLEQFVKTDFSVTDASTDNPALADHNYEGVTETFLEELGKREGVLAIGNIYYGEEAFWQELNDRDFERFRERLLDNPEADTWLRGDDLYEKGMITKIYGMDEYALENLTVLRGAFDAEKFATGNYVLVNEYGVDADDPKDFIPYFLPGESIAVKNADGEEKEYTVMATVDIPYALRVQNYMDMDAAYIFPTKEFQEFFGSHSPMRCVFDVTDETEESMENWIRDYTTESEPNLTYTSRAVYKNEFADFTNMLKLAGGLLTGVLALIGLLNLINTLITSILARRLEFAMLEAVGMTKKLQRRSICLEGVIYGGLSLLCGLLLSSLFSVLFVKAFGEGMWYFTWSFTLLPVLLLFPFMLLATLLIPVIIYKILMRQTVVERLRIAET